MNVNFARSAWSKAVLASVDVNFKLDVGPYIVAPAPDMRAYDGFIGKIVRAAPESEGVAYVWGIEAGG